MTTRVTVSAILVAALMACFQALCCGSETASSTEAVREANSGAQLDSHSFSAPAAEGNAVQAPLPATSSAVTAARAFPFQVLRVDGKYVFPEVFVRTLRPTPPFSAKLDYETASRTPATFSDPMRAAILAMPGVTARDELFARPSVNGGLPEWVSVQYGGFADTYPYVLYGTVSIANSQFDELRLLKGAFPVEYGDALSGLVLLEPRRVETAKAHRGFSLDLLRSSFYANEPVEGGSYGVAVETSFFDKILGPITDTAYPGSSSLLADVSKKLGRTEVSMRVFQATGGTVSRIEPGQDRYTSADAASQTLKRRYELSAQEKSSKATHVTSLAIFTDSEKFNASDGLMGRDLGVLSQFSAKVDLGTSSVGLLHKTSVSLLSGHTIDVGASVRNERLRQFTQTEGWNFVPVFNTGPDDAADTSLSHLDQTLRLWRYAVYAQDRCLLAGYRVTVGARYDVLNSGTSPAVRASVERQLGPFTFKLAGGQYNRFPLSGTFLEGRIARLADSYTEPESAVHLLLGADVQVAGSVLSVDLNRQKYSHLVTQDAEGRELRNGSGELRAVDVTVSTPNVNSNFWVYATASFGETRVMGIPTDWDQNLVAKAVCFARPLPRLELTTRAFYGSGLAYTPLIGRMPLTDLAGRSVTDAVGNAAYSPVWGEENSDRLPAQFRLDVRVATTRTIFARQAKFFLEGLNLTKHKNVSGLDYFDYYSRTVYRTNVPRVANVGMEFYF
jgi:hypothetical protein